MSHESKPNYFKKKSCKNSKLNQLRPKMTNKVHFDLWNNILFWQNNISLLYVTMSKLCGSRMDENTVFQIEQLLDKNYNGPANLIKIFESFQIDDVFLTLGVLSLPRLSWHFCWTKLVEQSIHITIGCTIDAIYTGGKPKNLWPPDFRTTSFNRNV